MEMRLRVAAIVAATAFLAACGGGGSGGGGNQPPPPPPASGVLHGGIRGVAFSTPTRSGLTDAAGAFTYLPGETVTFSLGSVQLGSAPGAAGISLFALAGLTPPATELDLRRELARINFTATRFSRAANLSLFMLALDGDGNPETGIDIAGRAADFSNASVDFDALRHEFASSLQRTAPDLNINIPDSRPIVWMYRSIGIAVPGNRLARQRDDWNADGAIDSDMTPNFDASGEVISTVRDLSGDGRPDEFVYYARDVLGRPTITRTDIDDDRDGTLDQRRTVRVTADAWGNPFRRIEHEDFGVDGTTDTQLVVDATFDRFGRPLTSVYSFDMNFDGVQDIVERHTITRDARGNPLSSVIEVDLDNDGTADGRYENTSTFDGNDRLLTQVYERDLDGDGQLESRMSQAWTYDAAGRVSAGATQDDADGDGAFERSENSTNDYDAVGNLVHSLSQGTTTNYPYSFMVDSRYEYDADRRRLRTVQDYSFAGSPTSRFTETNAYDVNGFPVSWESRNDDLFGGYWLDYANYTHSGEGAQTSLTTGSRDDQGFNEISQTQNFEYVTSPDALTQIVTYYLPPL